MRVVVTGGGGFIGRAIVERLAARGDDVVALVRDPARAGHLRREHVTLVVSDLSSVPQLTAQVKGADALIHAAGMYVVGIKKSQRQRMWDANVGTTERVLDAAIAAKVPRIVYVSTVGIFGDTHGELVDETYARNLDQGFISSYDETKFLAHEVAQQRVTKGAPIVIVQPSQVYGPNDHTLTSIQIEHAYSGKLRYAALTNSGTCWVHVEDLADGIIAALDSGRIGESYVLAGECTRLADAIAIAALAAGRKPPRMTMPTSLLRLMAPINDRLGGLPGLPANLAEVIKAGAGVTYWASHEKARRELGFQPRSLQQGINDTWGTGNNDQSRHGH
jgi:dihydroflavonol-4-reductase/farnesol dehydrogenase